MMDKGMQALARSLASEDRVTRTEALKRLKLFISTRVENGNFFELTELKKLWKCLFYCLWNCDTMVRQEKLSKMLSKLTPLFVKIRQKMSFIKGFFFIVRREWLGLDTHRQDKYLFLIRVMVRSGFKAVSEEKLSLTSLKLLSSVYQNQVLNVENIVTASAVEYHVCDVFFDEAVQVISEKLENEVFMRLCYPFFHYLKYGKDSKLCYHMIMNMFLELTGFSKYTEKKSLSENVGKISIDRNAFVAHVSSLAMSDDIRETNRNCLMFLVQRWKRQTLELDSLESSAREALEAKKLKKEKRRLREEKEIEEELQKAGLSKPNEVCKENTSEDCKINSAKISGVTGEENEKTKTRDRTEEEFSDMVQSPTTILSEINGNKAEKKKVKKGKRMASSTVKPVLNEIQDEVCEADKSSKVLPIKRTKKKQKQKVMGDDIKTGAENIKEKFCDITAPSPPTKRKRKNKALCVEGSDAVLNKVCSPKQSLNANDITDGEVDAKKPKMIKEKDETEPQARVPDLCEEAANEMEIDMSADTVDGNNCSAFQVKEMLGETVIDPKLSRDQRRRNGKQEQKSRQLRQFKKRAKVEQPPDALSAEVQKTNSLTAAPKSVDFVTTPISQELRNAYAQSKSSNSSTTNFTPKLGANFVKIDKVPRSKATKNLSQLSAEEIDLLPSFTRRIAENSIKMKPSSKNSNRGEGKDVAFGRSETSKSNIEHKAMRKNSSSGRVSFDVSEVSTTDNSTPKETSLISVKENARLTAADFF